MNCNRPSFIRIIFTIQWVLGVSLLALPLGASNTEPLQRRDADVAEALRVHVVWIGTPAPVTFVDRVASWFEAQVTVRVETRNRLELEEFDGKRESDEIQVWIDVGAIDRAKVFFSGWESGGGTKRYLTRDVELLHGLDDLGCERLAQVVYSSILALKQGDSLCTRDELLERMAMPTSMSSLSAPPTVDLTPKKLPEAQTTVPPVPQSPRGKSTRDPLPVFAQRRELKLIGVLSQEPSVWHFSAATGYGANNRGDTWVSHGPAMLGMVGRSRGEIKWSGFVSARYLFPVEPTELSVTVRQKGFRLRMGGLVEMRLSPTFGVLGGAGAGMDWLNSQPRTDSPRLQALAGGWDELPFASGLVGALAVTPIGSLVLLGELDYQLRNSHYDLAKADGTARTLLSPNRFQPGISLYLRFSQPTL